ncbi:MAG: heavy metal translocating P-type ATPase [Pseudomonadales bacterium]|nr:heavy metal translocating P-type ATPase [Pseudomonadales bacterium]
MSGPEAAGMRPEDSQTRTSEKDLTCYHCQLPIPDDLNLKTEHDGKQLQFCCLGCQAVAETILGTGLTAFYQYRNERLTKPELLETHKKEELHLYDRDDISKEFTEVVEERIDGELITCVKTRIYVEGITCAACVWLLEQHLNQQHGVVQFKINHSTQIATAIWNPELTRFSDLLIAIHGIGYSAKPYQANEVDELQQKQQKQAIFRLGVAGIGTMQNMMLAVPLYVGALSGISDEFLILFRWVSLLVATPVVLYSAKPFFEAALRDLKTRHLTMDVPVSLAIGGAYLASAWVTLFGGAEVYFDSVCMFTFFLLLGRFFEMRTRFKSTLGIRKLQQLLPTSATRIAPDGTEHVIAAKEVKIGDILHIKQGDTAPCDGTVSEGSSSFDESALTGEFIPVSKKAGDTVLAGTVNIEQTISICASKEANHSRISAILDILQDALQHKPPLARQADKIASYFVAGVLLVATAVAVYWGLNDPDHAFAITLSVLVITCPCALSLATPTTLTAATDKLREIGLLIVKGHAIETLAKTNHIVLDKTGTLTEGKLTLKKIKTWENGVTETKILDVVGALERHSNHPIASVFRAFGKHSASQVQIVNGQGIEGVYQNTRYRIGNQRFISEWHSFAAAKIDQSGESASHLIEVYLASEKEFLATIYLDDNIRKDAAPVIRALHAQRIKTYILSGDRLEVVQPLADQLGIENYKAEASPEDKLNFLKALQSEQNIVTMVGDGINDVPVMAGANVSVAMGNARDFTKVNADSILMNNDLASLEQSIHVSQKSQRIISQNLAWALSYNILALPMAVMGMIPPYLAALGMSLSSLIVVINALRVKR